jgi:hypothetical protein
LLNLTNLFQTIEFNGNIFNLESSEDKIKRLKYMIESIKSSFSKYAITQITFTEKAKSLFSCSELRADSDDIIDSTIKQKIFDRIRIESLY